MKKSKWFNGAKFVPAHVGDYETREFSRIFKCFAKRNWNGKEWSAGWFHEFAMKYAKTQTALSQSPTWRGIKK